MSVNRYADASVVTVVMPSADAYGNPINADSAEYKVVDQNGAEIIAKTALIGFTAGDSEATVTVLAINNTLGVTETRALRKITLYLTSAGGTTVTNEAMYVIEGENLLVKGDNSFQSWEEATFLSLDQTGLSSWDSATEADKKAALVTAYRQLSRMYFIDDDGVDVGPVKDLDSVELDALTTGLFTALKTAQIVEADEILSGDQISDLRSDGLMATSIGEVSQMFRPGKPLLLPVSRRSLKFLSGYVSYSIRTTRG